MQIKALVAGVVLAATSGAVLAATQGSIGTAVPPAQASSQGDLIINLSIPNIVRISNLDDIDLGTYAGVDVSGNDDVCVYRNVTGDYSITAASTNTDAAGTFKLLHNDGVTDHYIAYSVDWTDGGGTTALTEGLQDTSMSGASTTSTTCGGGTNHNVAVTVLATDADAATATGAYSDTLVLTVESR